MVRTPQVVSGESAMREPSGSNAPTGANVAPVGSRGRRVAQALQASGAVAQGSTDCPGIRGVGQLRDDAERLDVTALPREKSLTLVAGPATHVRADPVVQGFVGIADDAPRRGVPRTQAMPAFAALRTRAVRSGARAPGRHDGAGAAAPFPASSAATGTAAADAVPASRYRLATHFWVWPNSRPLMWSWSRNSCNCSVMHLRNLLLLPPNARSHIL